MPRKTASGFISVPYGKPNQVSIYAAGSDMTKNFINWKWGKRLNQMSSFEADVIGVQSNDSRIQENSQIMFFTGSHLELKGILEKPKFSSFGRAKLEGTGMERALLQRSMGRKEWIQSGTDEIVTEICSVNFDAGSPWVMETGTMHNWGDITVRGEHSNRLRVISELAHISATSGTSITGSKSYDWYVDQSGPTFATDRLNFTRYQGSSTSVKTFTTGNNMKMVTYEKDTAGMANSITVLGYGDGANQISGTATDATSIAAYGTYEKTFVDRALINAGVAGSLAQSYLYELKDPVERIRLEVLDDNTFDVSVGDAVTLVDNDVFPSPGSSFRVVGIEKSRIGGRRKKVYELSNKSVAFVENISEDKKVLDRVGTYAKGSTDSFQIPVYENCDADYPLNLRIFTPSDVIRILKSNVSFQLKDYRSYTRSTVTDATSSTSSQTGEYLNTITSIYGEGGVINTASTGVRLNIEIPSQIGEYSGCIVTTSINNNYPSSQDFEWFLLKSGVADWYSGTQSIGANKSYTWNYEIPSGTGNLTAVPGDVVSFRLEGGSIGGPSEGPYTYITLQVSPLTSHSHTISHNHEMTYNISGVTLADPWVTLAVGEEGSETDIGSYSTTQTAVDIASHIQGAGSWTNIKFTPNKPMRIEANYYQKHFIESK